jgi:hypothetical protein
VLASVKLPQARLYLKSAQWGFDQLLSHKHMGYGFRFHVIGILAALRAVQHALDGHDRNLSADHRRVIADWWNATLNDNDIPDLRFIRRSRDLLLKRGSFPSFATLTEDTGDYDLAYYDDEHVRHDLAVSIRSALLWCDDELSRLEAQLPSIPLPP